MAFTSCGDRTLTRFEMREKLDVKISQQTCNEIPWLDGRRVKIHRVKRMVGKVGNLQSFSVYIVN